MTLNDRVKELWKNTKRNLTLAGAGIAVLAATGVGWSTDYKNPQGTVYDTNGAPLPGVIVTLLDVNQDTTDVNGQYDIVPPTSGIDELDLEPRYITKKVDGGGCSGPRTILVPVDAEGNEIRPQKQFITEYTPDMLTFEKPGYWLAQADVSDSVGTFTFNATLPANVGSQYGEITLPEQFGAIWSVYPVTSPELIPHRTQDLPMPVDGDMDTQSDWDLVQASIDRINEISQMKWGIDWMYLAPGNGWPTRGPPEHQGIYVFHDSFHNQGQTMVNNTENPEYLIGGIAYLMNGNFLDPSGRYLDHELIYRMLNSQTYSYNNGIFKASGPLPITNFNREQILLFRSLVDSKEQNRNDLIALDYVRQFF